MRFLFGVGREGPNPSSKSSSNVTLATFAPQPLLANAGQQQHGVAATLGMAAPGMSATEAGRVFLPSGAAQQQLENWGDSVSGVVVTSPLTETSTDLDDSGDMRHRASMVGARPVLAPLSYSWLTRRIMQFRAVPCWQGGGGGDGDGAGQPRLGCVDSSDRRGDQKVIAETGAMKPDRVGAKLWLDLVRMIMPDMC
jgi:hypothetical protein